VGRVSIQKGQNAHNPYSPHNYSLIGCPALLSGAGALGFLPLLYHNLSIKLWYNLIGQFSIPPDTEI